MMTNSNQVKNINKINDMLIEQRKDKNIDKLMCEFDNLHWEYILIGGCIRDAIEGKKPRDIDIIVNIEDSLELESKIRELNICYKKNNLDGYKLFFSNITFDVWLMKNHYSFKQMYYKAIVSNIKKTTFTNYDSLVYNVTKNVLDISNYESCVQNRLLDLIGSDRVVYNNPTPSMNVVKLMKVKKESGYGLSRRAQDYVFRYVHSHKENIMTLLNEEYSRHYRKEMSDGLEEYIEQNIYNIKRNIIRS